MLTRRSASRSMVRLAIFEVAEPFLELTSSADSVGQELGARPDERLAKLLVHAERLARRGGVVRVRVAGVNDLAGAGVNQR